MIRKKIFFIAHEISPCLGSECSSGWNVVRGLSKYHDLTIVYAKTNQFETENYEEQINNFFISNSITKDAIFIALAQPRITKLIASLNKFISNNISTYISENIKRSFMMIITINNVLESYHHQKKVLKKGIIK
jgi:hypothetical protein